MVMRACIICGKPSAGSRCPDHQEPRVPWRRDYRQLRARLIAEHPYCHICGGSFDDPGDPAVLDHVVPRAHGGGHDAGNLAPAHPSCNGRKGATIGSWVEPPLS